MAEYIEREAAKRMVVEAVVCARPDVAELLKQIIDDLPAADAIPAEEFALLEAKNEVLGQENDRLKEEVKRLHEENFWLTGGLGHEEG